MRSAIVALETLIWLPVILIVLAAVIEMGLLLTGAMHVEAASRLGAKLAAETVGLSPATSAATAMTIRNSVDNYLENAGFGGGASVGVRLQHNVMGGASVEDGSCPPVAVPPLPPSPPASVRVVVCVAAPTLAPNILKTFGFDTATCTVEVQTTFPYEL